MEDNCRCGHTRSLHHHNKSCTAILDGCADKIKYCPCEEFMEAKSQEEIEMSKKKVKKESKGRTPSLAPFVDAPFKIWMTYEGKEHEAQVISSGIIRIGEKEFTSPSSAAQHFLGKNKKGKQLQADGWRTWRFNKDGERVPLDTLRGSKSPLKAESTPKSRKAKSAKANGKPNGSAKPKPPRKPRVHKPKAAEPPTLASAAERSESQEAVNA